MELGSGPVGGDGGPACRDCGSWWYSLSVCDDCGDWHCCGQEACCVGRRVLTMSQVFARQRSRC